MGGVINQVIKSLHQVLQSDQPTHPDRRSGLHGDRMALDSRSMALHTDYASTLHVRGVRKRRATSERGERVSFSVSRACKSCSQFRTTIVSQISSTISSKVRLGSSASFGGPSRTRTRKMQSWEASVGQGTTEALTEPLSVTHTDGRYMTSLPLLHQTLVAMFQGSRSYDGTATIVDCCEFPI